jgi:hypothetical protein
MLIDVGHDSDFARETSGKVCYSYPLRPGSHTLISDVKEQSARETKYQNGYLSLRR